MYVCRQTDRQIICDQMKIRSAAHVYDLKTNLRRDIEGICDMLFLLRVELGN